MVFKWQSTLDLRDLGEKRTEDKVLLNFLLTIIKAGLRRKRFNQIGRLPKFFLKEEKRSIPGEDLIEAWPGFEFNPKWYSDGIYVNIDTCTKFINKFSVLDDIDYYMEKEKWG